jgi:hypothetical protein
MYDADDTDDADDDDDIGKEDMNAEEVYEGKGKAKEVEEEGGQWDRGNGWAKDTEEVDDDI